MRITAQGNAVPPQVSSTLTRGRPAGRPRGRSRASCAISALVDLALQQNVAFVSLQSIAQRQQMSLSHLEHLFARLRRHGLVRASRGPGGGYALARSAVQISIADIVSAVDQSTSPPFDHSIPASGGGLTPEAAIAESLWQEADAHLLATLQDIDLHCLVETERASRPNALAAQQGARSPVLARPKVPAQNPSTRAVASVFDLAESLA